MTAPGWYHAEGDAAGTTRYWDGTQWIGDPVVTSTGPVGPPGLVPGKRLASPGQRIGARIIDAIIGVVITLVFLWSAISDIIDGIQALPPNASDSQVRFIIETNIDDGTTMLFIGVVAAFAIEWLFVAFLGGTLGKLILGLRVSDAATGTTPPAMGQAALRSVNRLLPLLGVLSVGAYNASSGISLLIGLVSLIMLFSDDRHRTVMDRVAKTIVTVK